MTTHAQPGSHRNLRPPKSNDPAKQRATAAWPAPVWSLNQKRAAWKRDPKPTTWQGATTRWFLVLLSNLASATLGWTMAACTISVVGMFVVVAANTVSRWADPLSVPLFWIGCIACYAPLTWRLFAARVTETERVTLLVMMGISLYMIKLSIAPVHFTLHDEFAHWRTVTDIIANGRLFGMNPVIPVASLYPGLGLPVTVISQVTGIPPFESGIIVIGIARIVMMLSLYEFFRFAVRSGRVAAIGVALYAGNPNFVYFTAQFSYESLALPLLCFTLFLLTLSSREDRPWTYTIMASAAGLTTVMTHHVTSYMLAAFCVLWTIMLLVRRRGAGHWIGPPVVAAVVIAGFSYWSREIAPGTGGYLGTHISAAIQEAMRIFQGRGESRELFKDYTGVKAPLLEQLTGFASAILVVLPMPIAYLRLRLRPPRAALSALAIAAAGYPIGQAGRFTEAGREAANRTSEFLFIALAVISGYAVVTLIIQSRNLGWRNIRISIPTNLMVLAMTLWATIIFAGGIIIGTPVWMRQPGPYLVSADNRSVEPKSIAAARWAFTWLGPNNRISADRINDLILATYGKQRIVTLLNERVNMSEVFLAPVLTDEERKRLAEGKVEYLLVDSRLTTGLPLSGVYFEMGEKDTFEHRRPVDAAAIQKFLQSQQYAEFSRLYDNGSIAIYQYHPDGSIVAAPPPP